MQETPDKVTLHGVLVSVDNTGVLISGEAGTGKSDCALQLISLGHALVADDVVEVTRTKSGLVGSAPLRFQRLLNVADLGIVDVVEVFSTNSFKAEARIEIAVELVRGQTAESAKTGFERMEIEILGLLVQHVRFRIDAARGLPLLIETAVKLLRKPTALKKIETI